MSYYITVSGKKSDLGAKIDAAAQGQRASLPHAEQEVLDKDIDDLKARLQEIAGDDDAVSVTLTGSMSQSAGSYASQKSTSFSVQRGAAAGETRSPATGPTQPGISGAPARPASP